MQVTISVLFLPLLLWLFACESALAAACLNEKEEHLRGATLNGTKVTTRSQSSSISRTLVGIGGDGSLLGSIATTLFGRQSSNCPPAGFRSRPTLSLDTYISALWFPQKAAPVLYAQGQSFCSVVKYTLDPTCTVLCGNDPPRINVRNRGLAGSISGTVNDACLRALVPNVQDRPAEVRVSFPQRIYTPSNYWVVDAGLYHDIITGNHTYGGSGDESVYEWAIISGGAPTRESNGACIAGCFGQFDTRGLWIFARHPFPPEGAVDAIDSYAASMGLDTSAMIDVVHEGCTYDFLPEKERPELN